LVTGIIKNEIQNLDLDVSKPRTTFAMQEEAEFVFFCSHKGEAGYLSNWYSSKFTLDGITFNCVEQAMMWGKATLMGDQAAADLVLTLTDPKAIKALRRSVKNFDAKKWDEEKARVVKRALDAKFRQNKELGDKLKATKDATLVEAAHCDTVWGNGLSADHPDAKFPDKWPGQNLLGQLLMDVRLNYTV
jgi:ribA/ribD-fused uncharacterized protein